MPESMKWAGAGRPGSHGSRFCGYVDEPETLGHDQGVIVDQALGIAQFRARFRAVPEAFMTGPPLCYRRVALTLVENVLQVDIAEPDHPDTGYLDGSDSPVSGVHHC